MATSLGPLLRQARLALSLRQEDLAPQIGTKRRAIGAWERGASSPRPKQRAALVRALAMRDIGWATRIAEALGVAPPPGATPAPAVDAALDARIDAAAFAAADTLDASPRALRRALATFATQLQAAGVPFDAALARLLRGGAG